MKLFTSVYNAMVGSNVETCFSPGQIVICFILDTQLPQNGPQKGAKLRIIMFEMYREVKSRELTICQKPY